MGKLVIFVGSLFYLYKVYIYLLKLILNSLRCIFIVMKILKKLYFIIYKCNLFEYICLIMYVWWYCKGLLFNMLIMFWMFL